MQDKQNIESNSIDWHAQWAQFAPGFKEGFLTLPIKTKEPIRLMPGPGFGDLSHPTTQLMLDALYPLVVGKKVLDIGCGSGILTLASLAYGAIIAIGLDIEEEALIHAEQNARLNNLHPTFCHPSSTLSIFDEGVILMNMITSEQKRALEMLPQFSKMRGDLLLSGLLVKEKGPVISTYEALGWTYKNSRTKKGWALIHFTR